MCCLAAGATVSSACAPCHAGSYSNASGSCILIQTRNLISLDQDMFFSDLVALILHVDATENQSYSHLCPRAAGATSFLVCTSCPAGSYSNATGAHWHVCWIVHQRSWFSPLVYGLCLVYESELHPVSSLQPLSRAAALYQR